MSCLGVIYCCHYCCQSEYAPVSDIVLRLTSPPPPQVDLVEAGTYLAKALWYLDEQGVTHGNLRCRNVLVSSRAENKFHVRLADPGLRLYSQNE